MRKKLLSIGLIALSFSVKAQVTSNPQVLCHVDDTALFYVGKGALVFNGGGLQVKNSGKYENFGNVMMVASDPANDVFRTVNGSGVDKTETTSGGTFVNRITETGSYASTNSIASGNTYTYGQLFIKGFSQSNLVGIVDQEYKNVGHGSYQQIALPFFDKPFSTLSGELGKTFTTQRWSKNEILKWNNPSVRFDHYTSLATKTSDPTAYYILGGTGLDVSTVTRVMKGRPYADGTSNLTVTLQNAGAGINFNGGYATNIYNEKYNTYLQDGFQLQMSGNGTAWQGDFGRNIYQFANPFLTNIDLRNIFINEGAGGDGVHLTNIYGIKVEQGNGTVSFTQNVGGGSSTARYATWDTNTNSIVGSVDWLIVRPGSVFVVKLKDNNTPQEINFNNLRRFNYTPRTVSSYSVTTAKLPAGVTPTVKQLGVFALDAAGNEVGRAYYAVSPYMITGHSTGTERQVTAASSDIIGILEEEPTSGGADLNYSSKYWLNINEANEVDFKGKASPLYLYSSGVQSLKFELRENSELLPNGSQNLSAGLGFFYKLPNGTIMPITQGQVLPVAASNSGTEINLFYGEPNTGTLATTENVKHSRTMVLFNPNIDSYIVRFDPNWKTADIKVYDMSGKLVLQKDKVSASKDFTIELGKGSNNGFVVNIVSETGVKVNSKIIR